MHQCQGFKFETISDKHCIKRILEDNQIIKLFYQNSHKYNLNAQNWGGSKGVDKYYDICVVVNKKIWKEITNGNSLTLVPLTRNKLYVACTRARGNVYIICDENTKPYKKVY